MSDAEFKALRTCTLLCWQRRDDLALTSDQKEDVLIACMAVGTANEGEAASAVLGAMREMEKRQANFDRLLRHGGKS